MKPFAYIFLIICFWCFESASAFEFELDAPVNYPSAVAVKLFNKNQNQNSQNAKKTSYGGIKSFFNKNKSKKIKAQFDSDENGYTGTLPSIKSEFSYKTNKSTSKIKQDTTKDIEPEEFQKSNIDDPLFLDVILNKERPSQYIVDMFRILKFLEGFRPVVENHSPIQTFNANVNVLDLHARRIEKLYADKPESMSPSYYMLQNLAYKAKILGNLKFDANYYSKFSPVSGTQYAKENLISEDEKLLIELNKTVFEIQQLSNKP